jgi:hypothetical protein
MAWTMKSNPLCPRHTRQHDRIHVSIYLDGTRRNRRTSSDQRIAPLHEGTVKTTAGEEMLLAFDVTRP